MESTTAEAGAGRSRTGWSALAAVGLAAVVGIAIQADAAWRNSATYDEATYVRMGCQWWRTGAHSEMSRMGTPLVSWKLQHAPTLWILDATGHRDLVDDPLGRQAELLPLLRLGLLWIWLAAFGVTVWWARSLYGPYAMAFAAWLFALSPNLLAHGMLLTMEMPLMASTVGMFALFWKYLVSGDRRWFWAAAAACGLAWSCKFTAILYPPVLAVVWGFDRWARGERKIVQLATRLTLGMAGFVTVVVLTNLVLTGFDLLPFSTPKAEHPSLIRVFGDYWGHRLGRLYETPLPHDWVGFATQMHHQASGGPSYLFGERRLKGWKYYYFVAMAVKVPLTFWILVAARSFLSSRIPKSAEETGESSVDPTAQPRDRHDALLPVAIGCFLLITAMGSSRNYGVRYVLPLAPLAIVWVSVLAEISGWRRFVVPIGLVGAGLATATSHPYELTYFNVLAGGPVGGRHILADSNLDWGQGLVSLARIQRDEPEFRDLTLYYFGEIDPVHYGVNGTRCVVEAFGDHDKLPSLSSLKTRYVGVSASLQWGPWGPAGFFDRLNGVAPIRMTDDTTIAIYKVADIPPAEPGVR